jgi:AcrR family transcriptional regulator
VATASPASPRTQRGEERRSAVLDAAAQLFSEHGFHGASIDEVGAAAGITGPGLYRHFPSKDALLMAVLDRLWSDGFKPAIVAAADLPPRDALSHLIAAHVELAIGQRTALVLLVTELRHLPADYRGRADRNLKRYVDAWVGPLRQLRSDVGDAHARAVATALHGLIDSAARTPHAVAPATRAPLLRDLAAGIVDRFAAAT